MDSNSFDTLARSFCSSASRRGVVSGSLAGLVALLLPMQEAHAKRGNRHGKDHGSGGAQDRARDHSLGAEKKRKHKRKKKPVPCAPNCTGKGCGPDGCGGTCGSCAGHQLCQNGQCVASCTRDCNGKTCGADGCGGTCGSCGGTQICQGGTCLESCTPNCLGKTCDGDGCGGSCGECTGALVCRDGNCALTSAGTCTQGHDYCLGDPGAEAPSRTCGSGQCQCFVRHVEHTPFCGTGTLCGCDSDAYCVEVNGPGSVCVECTHCIGQTVNTACVSPCRVQ
jgi:hypothetical protein